jgi:chromosomal replication initiation ATPase DnaA
MMKNKHPQQLQTGDKQTYKIRDYKERYAIVKGLIEENGVTIPDNVINLISKKIQYSVLHLQIAVASLSSYTLLSGKPITLENARSVLQDTFFMDFCKRLNSIKRLTIFMINKFKYKKYKGDDYGNVSV